MERPINIEIKEGYENPNFFRIQINDESGFRIGSVHGTLDPYTRCVKLESIEVGRDNRRKGLGSQLLRKFIEYSKDNGAEFIVGEVLPLDGVSYDEVCDFYKKNGAKVDEDGIITFDLTVNPSEE